MKTTLLIERLFILIVVTVILYIAKLAFAQEQNFDPDNRIKYNDIRTPQDITGKGVTEFHVASLRNAEDFAQQIRMAGHDLKVKGNARSRSASAKIAVKRENLGNKPAESKETLAILCKSGECSTNERICNISQNGQQNDTVKLSRSFPEPAFKKSFASEPQRQPVQVFGFKSLYANECFRAELPDRQRVRALALLEPVLKGVHHRGNSYGDSQKKSPVPEDPYFTQFTSLFDKRLFVADNTERMQDRELPRGRERAGSKPKEVIAIYPVSEKARRQVTIRLKKNNDDEIFFVEEKNCLAPVVEKRPLLVKSVQ